MTKPSRKAAPSLAANLKRLVPIHRTRDHRRPALSPDTVVHVGERKTAEMLLDLVDYRPDGIRELTTSSVEQCLAFDTMETPTWIRVVGLHDVEKVSQLLEAYHVHPLVQSDIVNTNQLPKVDSFDEYLFVVVKMIVPAPEGAGMLVEHFSLLFVDHLIITFQESPTPIFEPVLARLRSTRSRLRQCGPDYLVWAILDAVVDHYFVVLDRIEDEVAGFDDLLDHQMDAIDPATIHTLKRHIFHLHRLIRPARDVAASLARSESELIGEKTHIYFRDLYDHVIHAVDIAETLKEAATTLREYYMAAMNNRLNETMKVLTVFSTIFLPLTFIAGIYGMNFRHMPELGLRWAYPALWAVFLLLPGAMFVFFRRKRWL